MLQNEFVVLLLRGRLPQTCRTHSDTYIRSHYQLKPSLVVAFLCVSHLLTAHPPAHIVINWHPTSVPYTQPVYYTPRSHTSGAYCGHVCTFSTLELSSGTFI